jgi:hypothetical protein
MAQTRTNSQNGLAFPITFRKARLYSEFNEIPHVRDIFHEFSTLTETACGERASNLPEHAEPGDYKTGKPDKFSYLRRRNAANAFLEFIG